MKTFLAATLSLTAIGCDAQGETVGPRGGVVVSDDGRLTLEIPEGALDREVEITIVESDDAPSSVLGTVYSIEPAGLVFSAPATLVYDVSASSEDEERAFDLAKAGVEMESLVLLGEKNSRWQPLPDRDVDADDEFVTASVLWLSSYAIAARP